MLILVQLTEKCSLNCKYCFEGEKGNKSMSFEFGKKVIDFSHQKYLKQLDETNSFEELTILFYGGEPLLEFALLKDLFLYSEMKADNYTNTRIKYAIITNGYNFSPEIIHFFCEQKDKFVIKLSLDGNKETHNANRRNYAQEETFDQIFKNAQVLRDQFGKVQIAMVVTPEQVECLYDNVRFLAENGFNKIEFELAMMPGWNLEHFQQLEEQIDKVLDYYFEKLQQNPDFKLVTFDNWLKPFLYKSGPFMLCGAGKNSFYINTEGKIYTCSFGNNIDECCFGDIENGFTENLNVIKTLDLDRFPEECKGCAYYNKCCFSCIAQNKFLTNSIYDIAPFSCAHSKLSMEKGIEFGNRLYSQLPEIFHKRFQDI